MNKLVTLFRKSVLSSKANLMRLLIFIIIPTKVNAQNLNPENNLEIISGSKSTLDGAPVTYKINVRDSGGLVNLKKVYKIKRIQPCEIESINFQKPVFNDNLELEIYAYPLADSPIIIDHKELKIKQVWSKSLLRSANEPSEKVEFLQKVRIGDGLLQSAKDYYSENRLKSFPRRASKEKSKLEKSNLRMYSKSISGTHILAIRLGRLCEDEGTRMLKSEFYRFKTPFKSIETPVSSIFRETTSDYPCIYFDSEWPSNLLKLDPNSDNFLDRLTIEFDTMPLVRYSFDAQLNFSDFNHIWATSDIEYSLKKSNRIVLKVLNQYELKLKPKKSLFRRVLSIRKISIPTKRQVRDACVDGITQFFKFKKWMHKNVQRPLTNFVRSKTGDFFLASPHLQPFSRKYGFTKFSERFSPINIKYERLESINYRWKHYNKLEFKPDKTFLLTQCLDNPLDSVVLLPQTKFVSLPLKFKEAEFIPSNMIDPIVVKRSKKKKNSLNKRGFHPLDILIPQSSGLNIPNGKRTTNPETFVFSRILNYDRKYVEMKNAKACRSWRYHIFYHRIAKEIMDQTKLSSDTSIPPTFLIGPFLLKEKGILVNNTCGYGLGYIKIEGYKFYLNPVTGLISIYQNSNNENFYGDDKTTYFGVLGGRSYYSDKTGQKYFYVDNFDSTMFAYSNNDFSIKYPIKSRKNPFYWKREYYFDTDYVQIKKLAGPWNDVRATVRHQSQDFYEIKKDVHFDIIPRAKKGVKLKFNSRILLRTNKFKTGLSPNT